MDTMSDESSDNTAGQQGEVEARSVEDAGAKATAMILGNRNRQSSKRRKHRKIIDSDSNNNVRLMINDTEEVEKVDFFDTDKLDDENLEKLAQDLRDKWNDRDYLDEIKPKLKKLEGELMQARNSKYFQVHELLINLETLLQGSKQNAEPLALTREEENLEKLTAKDIDDKSTDRVYLEDLKKKLEKLEAKVDRMARVDGSVRGRSNFEYESLTETFPFPQQISQGMVVEITRFEPDHIPRLWTTPLFIRQHLVDQLERTIAFLDDAFKRKLYVTGAPGCGKTCFFWMLALMVMNQGKKVLFIQYRRDKSCPIWVMEKRTIKLLKSPTAYSSDVDAVVKALLEKHDKFDVCICDGVRMTDGKCGRLREQMERQLLEYSKILKLVIVTSLQFRISLGNEMIGRSSIVHRISFDSWRKEDYDSAVSSDLMRKEPIYSILLQDWNLLRMDGHRPLDRVQLLEVVRQKYHFAGGCARYMFDMDLDTLCETLDHLFELVPDWTVFTRVSMPYLASDAVNSLMQQFADVDCKKFLCTPVSKFVLLRAYNSCRTALTAAVQAVAVATQNASLKGWAFELGQLDTIQSAYDQTKAGMTTSVGNAKLEFCPLAECGFDGSAITGNVVDRSVIWCLESNQGCFDVAFYFENTLVTLQFTVAESHSLKLQFLKPLRAELLKSGLEVRRIVHVGVVQEDSKAFSFDRPTGQGRATRRTTAPVFSVEVATASKLKLISPAVTMASVMPGDSSFDIFENAGGPEPA